MGTWSEQYRQAVLGQGSVVRLIGSAMAAVEASEDAALKYRIANVSVSCRRASCVRSWMCTACRCSSPSPFDAGPTIPAGNCWRHP